MQRRPWSFRLPLLAQDALLALFVTVLQIQGRVTRDAAHLAAARPLTDFGNLGYVLLIVSGVVVAGRRRWPVAVFLTSGLASLVYYGLDFPDGPTWLGLFVALYTLTAYGDGRRSLLTAGAGITVLGSVALTETGLLGHASAACGWLGVLSHRFLLARRSPAFGSRRR